jgi:hypothetical protein
MRTDPPRQHHDEPNCEKEIAPQTTPRTRSTELFVLEFTVLFVNFVPFVDNFLPLCVLPDLRGVYSFFI